MNFGDRVTRSALNFSFHMLDLFCSSATLSRLESAPQPVSDDCIYDSSRCTRDTQTTHTFHLCEPTTVPLT